MCVRTARNNIGRHRISQSMNGEQQDEQPARGGETRRERSGRERERIETPRSLAFHTQAQSRVEVRGRRDRAEFAQQTAQRCVFGL